MADRHHLGRRAAAEADAGVPAAHDADRGRPHAVPRGGVPSVDIIDLEYAAWHTAADTLDAVSARSLQIVGDVLLAALPAIESRLKSPAGPRTSRQSSRHHAGPAIVQRT